LKTDRKLKSDRPSLAVYCLVKRFGSPKADVAIELDGGAILGCHFQVSSLEPRLAKSGQCPVNQSATQPQSPVWGKHSHILDCPDRALVHDPLHRADVTSGAGDQPGRAGQKAWLPPDLAHQPAASGSISQAREHISVDLADETEILYFGVLLQE
jgi:hypothetical protein